MEVTLQFSRTAYEAAQDLNPNKFHIEPEAWLEYELSLGQHLMCGSAIAESLDISCPRRFGIYVHIFCP